MNRIDFEHRVSLETWELWRAEEYVPILLRPANHFCYIARQLTIVARVNSRERLSAYKALASAHYVEGDRHVRPGRNIEAARVRMELEQL